MFKNDAAIVTNCLDRFYQESIEKKKKVINQEKIENITDDLNLSYFVSNGGLHGAKLEDFLKKYLSYSTRLHDPRYLAHQVAVPHYSGALGSFIDGFMNNAMAINEMGPSGSAIEYFVINWLLEKIGWSPSPFPNDMKKYDGIIGGGVLTHGGSLANLTALAAARKSMQQNYWEKGLNNSNLCVIAAETHYSIDRAIGILGIGTDNIYIAQTDKNKCIIPDKLNETLDQIKQDGKQVMALVTNGCSTSIGYYDPFVDIGQFCQENNIWFHIDAPHGACALLSDKYKNLMKGCDLADSITWDAHKMMRTPTLCAAALFKNHQHIDSAFTQEASYLFHDKDQPGYDFIHRTVECTKAALGLRFYMVLGSLGEKGLASYVNHQYDLATKVYNTFNSDSFFEFACPPQSNIVCFRIKDLSCERQLEIRDQILNDGNFYISSTIFNKKRYLRLSIMNPDSSMKEISKLFEMIKDLMD